MQNKCQIPNHCSTFSMFLLHSQSSSGGGPGHKVQYGNEKKSENGWQPRVTLGLGRPNATVHRNDRQDTLPFPVISWESHEISAIGKTPPPQ